MSFKSKIALLMILSAIQFPYAGNAAEEDRELSLIAAEQENSGEDEELGEINPALTESISTAPTQETDKEIRERQKKLKQTRKEKEKINEQKLKDSMNRDDEQQEDETIIIEPTKIEPPTAPPPQPVTESTAPQKPKVEPNPTPQPVTESTPPQPPTIKPNPTPTPPTIKPNPKPTPPTIKPSPTPTPPTIKPNPTPQRTTIVAPTQQPIADPLTPPTSQNVEAVTSPNQKLIYSNFTEVSRAVKFVPLYMPKKSGYEITAIYAGQGIAEVRYGRRWEPTVSLTVRTYKRKEGEEPQDISGVTGVKWRVDTTTGTTIYIAKISDTQQVAAWAVGHYTFSAQAENLSYAGFHSLVADELVELSTHYYLDF